MTRTQQFIEENKKVLTSGPAFFNPDTSLMKKEDFDKAKCKILLICPTPLVTKTVSSTVAALNDFVIEHCPDTFLDVAYFPEAEDIKHYDAWNVPYAIGHITHLDPSHFDLIGFSISVLHEIVAAPVMLKTFERCDKPIPLFWSQRKDCKLGDYPIFYAGGITATCGESMFGKVTVAGKEEEAYLDFMYLGDCGHTHFITNRFIEAKETGKVTRHQNDHDVPGYPHQEQPLDEVVDATTVQEFVESLFDLHEIYQPQSYTVEYNSHNQIIKNIKNNPKARDYVHPYYPLVMAEDLGIGRTVIPANGDNCGVTQTQVTEGCSAGGACNFCSEGNYTGGFVEKTPERTLWEMWESKKYSAGYKYKAFSFNTNYITNYKGQLGDWIRIYPKVTFLNMRMEELGRDPDALKMMKLVGSNRLSCPLEGMSPRLMNNLLNKCLSEEAINNVMSYCVHGKMTDIKVGGIFTGYEEDEDKQWICDFVDKYEERAAQEGGNFPFRLKMTPLVHYPLTPIEYLERKSAKKSFLGEHWLEDEWYEKFREHNVHFKVNGFRYSTFLEQTFVDLGRSLTQLVYNHFVSQCAPVYSLRSCATDEYLADLRSMIDVNVYFNDRDIDHYISPCHRIHIDLMGSYIPRARRMLRAKHNGSVFDNEPDNRCLLTRIGAQVKCYHNCAKEEPLQIYFDVEMDEEGNLHGDSYPLTGCQRCPSPEYRRQRLARKIYQTMDSDQLIAVPRIPQIQKIRFVLKRNQDYAVLNPNNTSHTFLTKFLQKSDTLLKAYHSVVCHNMFWQCGPGFKYFTSGFQVVDTMWSKNVISEVKSLIEEVNKELVSCNVVSAQDILRDEKLDIQDINFFTFESDLPKEYFDTASHHYKGEIYQEKAVQGFALELTQDSKLSKPVFVSKDGKTLGAFWIPAKYNPVMYLRGYLSTVKKMGEDAIVKSTDFSCQFVCRENRVPCKNCGKENGLISLITGKTLPFGKSCLCKALLTQLMK